MRHRIALLFPPLIFLVYGLGNQPFASPYTPTRNGVKMASFYQRKLPESCIAFSSKQGKRIFASALSHGGLKSFFPLIQQFTTQTEPAFCGLSTLVLVLNALSVDPRQHIFGPWRWYEERMLNCCMDLEEVKNTGITLKVFQCLAHCQGLTVDLHYADDDASGSLEDFRRAVVQVCVEDPDANTDVEDETCEVGCESEDPLEVLVVAYCRKTMGQTGSGHFSPIAAYDAPSDSVLILETARFKYGAHWAKLPLVFDAMKPTDPDTGRSRGFVLLSFIPPHDRSQASNDDDNESVQPISILFRSKMNQHNSRQRYKEFLSQVDGDITWEKVVAYWTKDRTQDSSVWNIVEAMRFPDLDSDLKQSIANLRVLLRELLEGVGVSDPGCAAHNSCVGSQEAMFVVYLASLDKETRSRIVLESVTSAPMHVKEQLMCEADLIHRAIEISDQTSF